MILPQAERATQVRYLIIAILFAISCFSCADRSALSQAVAALPRNLDLDQVRVGYLLSGFGRAYALGQLPAGGLLDRFGSARLPGNGRIVTARFPADERGMEERGNSIHAYRKRFDRR